MTVDMSPDTERVLGQIARGEMRCGPEAARAIAARHQAAYGNAVWGRAAETVTTSIGEQPDDAAWADALAALGGEA